MSIYDELLKDIKIPRFVPVKYHIPVGEIEEKEIPALLEKLFEERELSKRIKRGKTAAIAVGSREINHIDVIVKSVIEILKKHGVEPFIIPAMGSHGGATAEGQRAIIEGYGVTEKAMGVPIRASMETVEIGISENGIPVHIDRYADEADYIIPVGRIKPHTDFRGKIESGLMKMLTIGCGKQFGANICHTKGFPQMSENVTKIAREIIRKKEIVFGVGIIEDAFHGTYQLAVIPGEQIEAEEEKLLLQAKKLVPGIPFEKVDVLVLNEIGKDISGAGMDSNITGRSSMMGVWKPYIERIAVLDLSEKSHHNGCGIGGADVTTRRFFEKMDFETSYPNAITSHDPSSMKIPPVMPSDKNAVQMAIQTCFHVEQETGCKIVWMKNTLHFNPFYISEALLGEAESNSQIEILGSTREVMFDEKGNIDLLSW